MSLPPQKFRELCLQILYALEKASDSEGSDELLELVCKEIKVSKRYAKDAYELVISLRENTEKIDETLAPQIKDYTIDRLHDIDRAILRLIVYELFFLQAVSEKILISEGVRLARKFSTPEAGKFVNGVLDGLVKKDL